jgi:hypothetical protein
MSETFTIRARVVDASALRGRMPGAVAVVRERGLRRHGR